MFNAFFSAILELCITLINIFLIPVDVIIANAFPDFSNMVTIFNTVVAEGYFARGLAYFGSILPANTRSLIVLYLMITLAFYTVSLSLHAIFKVFTMIQNIKFW